jgi:hypothetical protein
MSDKKKIVIQMKGAAKAVDSEYVDAEEAERLLKEEVVPKIAKDDTIVLPGLVVHAKEVVSAKTQRPATVSAPVGVISRSVMRERF